MASNLFGQASKDDIKVGYIDPTLGYISGVTICEANQYAQQNPGTTFIFQDGNNNLQYLTINEVNQLTPTDLESNQDCEGIDQAKVCGPPVINIYGGGGVGAQANPIIGSDGSILAVDVVSGGYGYQYPPQVDAVDHCNYAGGAVLVAEIGETSEAYETYDQEGDFEEYELCDQNDVGYGDLYGPNGEYIGPWDPNLYSITGGDPIKQEIDDYQAIVRALARTPFWDSRKKVPNKITSSDSTVTISQAYIVDDSSHVELVRQSGNKDYVAWNDFMNTYAISPVPPSNVKGSDYAGILFSIEWTEDFPVTGEYTFRGLCDNIAQLYLDNEKITDLGSFADPVRDTKKLINEGLHNIRVDLFNVPIYETQNQGTTTTLTSSSSDIKPRFIQKGSSYYLEVGGTGSGKIDFVMEVNDSPVIAGLAAQEIILPSDNEKLKFTRTGTTGNFADSSFSIPTEETIKKTGTFTAGKTYGPIEINGAVVGAGTPKVSDNKIGFLDADGTDENIKLLIAEIKNTTSTSSSPSSITSTTASADASSLKTTKIFNTLDYIDKADRKLWRINPTAGPNSDFLSQYGVSPFDTTTKESQTDSFAGVHLIRWESVNFPVDGNYNIDIMVDDNVKLYIGNSSTGGKIDDGSGLGKDEILLQKNGYSSPGKSTGKTTESRYFKAGSYRIRAELEQIAGKPLAKGNPMALAVNIDVVTADTKVVSPKSWNENPMGVSVTIDAPPEPPPPQEPVPPQEGKCPNNPIWSTRFPQISGYWYPVNFPGPRTVTQTITEFTETPVIGDKQEVEFEVFSSGADGLSFVFTSVDGQDSFILYGSSEDKTTRKEKVQVLKNTNYVVKAKEDSTKYSSVEQGLIKGGTKDKEGDIGTSNKIFADYTSTNNDNDDIQVTVSAGTFTSSNKRNSKDSGRSTYDLTYKLDVAPGTVNTASTTTTTYDAPGWSSFMNRYAISPVKPLDTPGSDKSGATYTAYWNLDVPYDGFYGLQGTIDNKGRIIIDGNEISSLEPFGIESPSTTKVFLSKGLHKITAELYNRPVTTSNTINQKIFRTKDWQVSASSSTSAASSLKPRFIQKGSSYYLEVGGTGTGKIDFVMEVNDSPVIAGLAAQEIVLPSDNEKLKFTRTGTTGNFAGNVFGIPTEETIKNSGNFTAGKTYGPIEINGAVVGAGTPKVSDNKIGFLDADGTDENIKLLISEVKNSGGQTTTSVTDALVGGTQKDGVTYEGPSLFHYTDKRWGTFMNDNSVSPYLPPVDFDNAEINGTKKYTWKNVKFPESGQYQVSFQADNIGTLYINGTNVLTTTDFIGNSPIQNVNISSGIYDIVVEVENVVDTTNIFTNNPVGFALEINKDVTTTSSDDTPWSSNPMGISAILIPPPCPKKISGKGVIKRIVPIEPGGPYLPTPTQPGISTTYPVLLELTDVIIPPGGPGINYDCSNDKIKITPSNGTSLKYQCDSFGRITKVDIITAGIGFTVYPDITIESTTGVNFKAIPILTPRRDPVTVPPEKLIQVTDLVGLKQNGYIQGRAYFGSVFYKDGVRYAGVYETTGELIRVYDTLQESIDAQVTTPPSAIQRSGTDTELSSNNPKLNIPNTPENLV